MTRFVILAVPRSGSNLLCTLLQSHPAVLCHHELFNPQGVFVALPQRGSGIDFGGMTRREADPEGFLADVWRGGLGHTCVGFKFTRGQDEKVLNLVVDDPDIHKIVLRRRNRVKTLASELVAEARGLWELYDGEAVAAPCTKVSIEPETLSVHADLNAAFYEGIRARLAATAQTCLELDYEELFDPERQRRLLAFLGLTVPAEAPLRAASRKQNSSDLRDVIANFEDLDNSLRDSEFHAELHDRRP